MQQLSGSAIKKRGSNLYKIDLLPGYHYAHLFSPWFWCCPCGWIWRQFTWDLVFQKVRSVWRQVYIYILYIWGRYNYLEFRGPFRVQLEQLLLFTTRETPLSSWLLPHCHCCYLPRISIGIKIQYATYVCQLTYELRQVLLCNSRWIWRKTLYTRSDNTH